jgi:hypothetical protein
VVNYGNFGCGTVYKNFDTEPTVLKPIPTRVFGIGMHKTATTSLNAAFKILGYDSFHWDRGDLAREIWDQMNAFERSTTLERYYALSDLPMPLLYQRLDKAYPGSKFILTVRNELEWLMSVNRLWDARYNPNRWEWEVYPFTNRIHRALYGRTDFKPDVMLARYRQHNAEVLEYFKDRPDDLLVLDMDRPCAVDRLWKRTPEELRTGPAEWWALCDFLDLPVPDVPYPRLWVTPKPPPIRSNQDQVPVAVLEGLALMNPLSLCLGSGEETPLDDDTIYCGSATENAADVISAIEAEKAASEHPPELPRSIQPETVSLTLAPSDVGSLSADPSPVATDREPKESVKDGYRPADVGRKMICPNCVTTEISAKFCNYCGTALVEGEISKPALITCVRCGYNNIWPHEYFCRECGAEMIPAYPRSPAATVGNVRAADKPVEKPEQNWLQRLWAFLCWLFAVIVRLFSKAK